MAALTLLALAGCEWKVEADKAAQGLAVQSEVRDALNKERSDVILAFLRSLDELHRDVFILCELEQLSAPEIADAVSASTSAVCSRIRSARQALVKYVRDHHPDLMGEADG